MKEIRAERTEYYNDLNKKHNKKYYEKKSEQIKAVKTKIANTAHKKEAVSIATDILNSLIKTIPEEAKKKKTREAVARHRARANGEEQPKKRPGRPKINQ